MNYLVPALLRLKSKLCGMGGVGNAVAYLTGAYMRD